MHKFQYFTNYQIFGAPPNVFLVKSFKEIRITKAHSTDRNENFLLELLEENSHFKKQVDATEKFEEKIKFVILLSSNLLTLKRDKIMCISICIYVPIHIIMKEINFSIRYVEKFYANNLFRN